MEESAIIKSGRKTVFKICDQNDLLMFALCIASLDPGKYYFWAPFARGDKKKRQFSLFKYFEELKAEDSNVFAAQSQTAFPTIPVVHLLVGQILATIRVENPDKFYNLARHFGSGW